MTYKHDRHPHKTYRLTFNGLGYKLVEFYDGCRKTQLTLNREEKIMFEQRLKENGWYGSK